MSFRNKALVTALVLTGMALAGGTTAPVAQAPAAAPAAAPAPSYPPSINEMVAQTRSLQDLGFINATSVDMRFDDWVKAGYPVAKPK
jgi:hypothetical protein